MSNVWACPKCGHTSGNSWAQCCGKCPIQLSPHYDKETAARYGNPIPYVDKAGVQELENLMPRTDHWPTPREVAEQVFSKAPTSVDEAFAAGVEASAKLCERIRCRNWDAQECAKQLRDHLKRGLLRLP